MSNPFRCGRVAFNAWAVIGAIFTALAVTNATAAPNQPGQIDLATRLSRFDVQALEIAQPAIAARTTNIAMRLGNEDVVLHLSRHSVRSPNFRLLVQTETGIEERPAPPEQTWRGWVAGRPGSVVAGSIIDGTLRAMITLDDQTTYWVQPLRMFDAAADARSHIVYQNEDLLPGNETCGVPSDLAPAIAGFGGGGEGACTYGAEISFDADVEYYQLLGSDVNAVAADIDNIMNLVNVIYHRDVLITHFVGTVLVRTVEFDPYFATDPGGLLNEFKTEWNNNQIGVVRDVAHLMTGKELDGNVIGVAFLASVCDLEDAYGLSQSLFTNLIGLRVKLTAHELGHNWGALHCGSSMCSSTIPPQPCESTCSIMCTCVSGCSQGPSEFESCSAGAIVAYRNSADADCIDAVFPPGGQPPVTQELYGFEGDRFGVSIGMSGTIAIVGAYLDDQMATNAGAAYVYRFDPKLMTWVEEAKLLAPDGASSDLFGTGVDIIQEQVEDVFIEVAVVGAPGQNIPEVTGTPIRDAGAAYVFRRVDGGQWMVEAKLIAADWASGNSGDNMGRVVAITRASGTEVVITGAALDDVEFGNAGSAYIFRNTGAGWLQEQKIGASKPMFNDLFGFQVDIGVSPLTGLETALVSAYSDDAKKLPQDAGSVYVFQKNGIEWQLAANLTASDAAAFDNFGGAIAFSPDANGLVAIIGAPNVDFDENISNSGAAYFFRETAKGWVEEVKLQPNDPQPVDRFGYSVAIDGAVALVGTPFDNRAVLDTGSAYLYRYIASAWTLQNHFQPIDPLAGDNFGYSVAVSEERVMIGAWGEDTTGFNAGTVYTYTPAVLTDCNDNGVQDECDIINGTSLDQNFNGIPDECEPCFPTIDCNNNGVLDACDIAKGTSQDLNLNGIPDECEPPACIGDTNNDGQVNVTDLLTVISGWGSCPQPCPPSCPADINGDCLVNVTDLLSIISSWGACP